MFDLIGVVNLLMNVAVSVNAPNTRSHTRGIFWPQPADGVARRDRIQGMHRLLGYRNALKPFNHPVLRHEQPFSSSLAFRLAAPVV
jgi:hypothetical protein